MEVFSFNSNNIRRIKQRNFSESEMKFGTICYGIMMLQFEFKEYDT